ncbi:hypothetical protein SAMN04488020_1271, partial [Palleronia marisminoris]
EDHPAARCAHWRSGSRRSPRDPSAGRRPEGLAFRQSNGARLARSSSSMLRMAQAARHPHGPGAEGGSDTRGRDRAVPQHRRQSLGQQHHRGPQPPRVGPDHPDPDRRHLRRDDGRTRSMLSLLLRTRRGGGGSFFRQGAWDDERLISDAAWLRGDPEQLKPHLTQIKTNSRGGRASSNETGEEPALPWSPKRRLRWRSHGPGRWRGHAAFAHATDHSGRAEEPDSQTRVLRHAERASANQHGEGGQDAG